MSMQTRITAALRAVGADIKALWAALAGKANTSHTHAAAQLTSGVIDEARLPAAVRLISKAGNYGDPNDPDIPALVIAQGHPNLPDSTWWYVLTLRYPSSNNRCQIAVRYIGTTSAMRARHCYDGVWSAWTA